MGSKNIVAVLSFILGGAVGIGGYALYRGDLQWQPETASAPATEKPAQTAKAPAPKPPAPKPAVKEELPDLPISLNYYENRKGRGYIVQIHNESQKHLAVLVEFENPTLDQERSGALNLAPGEVQEVGAAQGWT